MSWIFPASVVFVLLHKVLENIVCSSGNAARRKHALDLGTAGVMVAVMAGCWAFVFFDTSFRQDYAPILFLATPFVVVGASVFAYMSRLAYESGEFDLYAEENELVESAADSEGAK